MAFPVIELATVAAVRVKVMASATVLVRTNVALPATAVCVLDARPDGLFWMSVTVCANDATLLNASRAVTSTETVLPAVCEEAGAGTIEKEAVAAVAEKGGVRRRIVHDECLQ
jgi:hypothetical protein